MNANMSDLREPLQAVLDRIPVQDLLEKVPDDVRGHLPERMQPEPRSHRRLWMTVLVLLGVGAIVVVMKRRSGGGHDAHHDHHHHDAAEAVPGGAAVVDRAETSGATMP